MNVPGLDQEGEVLMRALMFSLWPPWQVASAERFWVGRYQTGHLLEDSTSRLSRARKHRYDFEQVDIWGLGWGAAFQDLEPRTQTCMRDGLEERMCEEREGVIRFRQE